MLAELGRTRAELLAAIGGLDEAAALIEKRALSSAITRSQWSSIVVPMPTQLPCTAATSGLAVPAAL